MSSQFRRAQGEQHAQSVFLTVIQGGQDAGFAWAPVRVDEGRMLFQPVNGPGDIPRIGGEFGGSHGAVGERAREDMLGVPPMAPQLVPAQGNPSHRLI
jgi:hypothetical protein